MVGDAEPPPAPASAGTFRDRLRNCFSVALHGLAADGVVAIDAAEIPMLLEQVRETADAKFGDYSGTMAMGLAKKAGKKPRDLAIEIARRLAADCDDPATAISVPNILSLVRSARDIPSPEPESDNDDNDDDDDDDDNDDDNC